MTTRRIHRCAAVGCEKTITASWLMCGNHWNMVPESLKKRIHFSLRKSEMPKPDRKKNHRALCSQAMRVVREIEKKTSTR